MPATAAAPPLPAAAAGAPSAGASTAAAPEVPRWLQGRLKFLHPLYRAFELWSDADGLRMSAAMSFYGVLSLAPLLVLIVALLGWLVDRQTLETSLIEQIGGLVGQQGADVIRAALDSAREPGRGLFASLLAFGLLLVGATGVFAELQSALERLWTQGTGVAAVDAWWHSATLRLRGVAYILAFGFLMLVSTVIASLLSLLQTWVGSRFDMQLLLAAVNQIVSFLITTGLFVALMRMSAGPQPRLRYLVRGAAVGALLFGVGKYALALYLSTAAVVSAYGAAGSLVVLLMWIYFASAVLLFGASVARVMAEKHGQFSPAAKPPPAAAVTAVQAEARQAGAGRAAGDTATVAAVLSDVVARGQIGPPAPARLAADLAAEPPPRRADTTAHPRLVEGLSMAIALGAAVLLSRKVPGAAEMPIERAAERGRDHARERGRDLELEPAHRQTPREREASARRLAARAGSGAAALAAGSGALLQTLRRGSHWLQVATRIMAGDERPQRHPALGALRAWARPAPAAPRSELAAAWGRWRQRHALAQAQRQLARDVQALREQVRRR